jgi:hypothetical protein
MSRTEHLTTQTLKRIHTDIIKTDVHISRCPRLKACAKKNRTFTTEIHMSAFKGMLPLHINRNVISPYLKSDLIFAQNQRVSIR